MPKVALVMFAILCTCVAFGSKGAGAANSPSPKPTKTPERLRVITHVENNDDSPIYIYDASLKNGNGGTYMQCVSFRNVTNKVATDMVLWFTVTSRSGDVVQRFDLSKSGTFTPPIAIDDKCWVGYLWPDATVRRMAKETIRVTRVTFEDMTRWEPGLPFVRSYSNNGKKLEPR